MTKKEFIEKHNTNPSEMQMHAGFSIDAIIQMMRTTSVAKIRAELEATQKRNPGAFVAFAVIIQNASKST